MTNEIGLRYVSLIWMDSRPTFKLAGHPSPETEETLGRKSGRTPAPRLLPLPKNLRNSIPAPH